MSTTLDELIKASRSLKTSRDLLQNAITKEPSNTELHKALRDSCIQRFEFCAELAWKVSMKILGLTNRAPHPAIREMAQNSLIEDTQLWFDFLLARNKTSQSFAEEIAKAVYLEIERFIPELDRLIERLQKMK